MDAEKPQEAQQEAYLKVLEESLRTGDNEFATSLLLDSGPFATQRDLVETLVAKARDIEDPSQKALWYGGIELLYDQTAIDALSSDVAETLCAAHTEARQHLDVFYRIGHADDSPDEALTEISELGHDSGDPFAGMVEADDAKHQADAADAAFDPEGWADDNFEPNSQEEDYAHFPVLTAAIQKAESTKDLGAVVALITEEVGTGLAALFREVLDKYVYKYAESMISDRHNVEAAVEMIERYASSPETAFRMRLSLDKLIIKEASNMLETFSSPGFARRMIDDHASSSDRREAMLAHLGLAEGSA